MKVPSSSSGSSTGIATVASPYPFAETLGRLRAAISERGLTLFTEIDQQEAARGAGMAMPPAHLLLLGSPRAGTPLMVAVPEAGLDLPLKAWVWESPRGRTFITYNDPAFVAGRYGLAEELAAPLAGIVGLVAAVVAPSPHPPPPAVR